MFPLFPISLLQTITTTLNNKNKFYRENNYSNELSFIYCPNCKEKGGVYKGSVFICCANCMNLYYTTNEMLNYLNVGVEE